MGKFTIKTGTNGDFYFNLKAGNGEIILQSQGYNAKASCENGIQSVIENSQDDNRFERKESTNGKWYFGLNAKNGQQIGKSEMYESKAGMENGIASVTKNAADANIVDETN